jgi:hypothetical protein
LNGRNWDSPFLPYEELKNGGTIAFTMGAAEPMGNESSCARMISQPAKKKNLIT